MNMSLEKYIENIITWASTKGIKLINRNTNALYWMENC